MADKRAINSILVAVATMLVFATFEKFTNSVALPISIGMLVVGLAIIFFGHHIQGTSFLKKILKTSLGAVLFTSGAGVLIVQYVDSFWATYVVVGLLLFNFHDDLVEVL